MRRQAPEVANNFRASFLSYEKDMELIIDRLFNQNKLYGDYLKRLLVINQPDCLTANNAKYDALIKQYSEVRCPNQTIQRAAVDGRGIRATGSEVGLGRARTNQIFHHRHHG